MKYQEYTVEDFLQDDSFQAFALNHPNADKVFWTTWISEHPNKQAEVNEAIAILTSFSFKTVQPDSIKVEEGYNKLEAFIRLKQETNQAKPVRSIGHTWRIAASIVLILGITAAAFKYVTYFKSKASQIIVEKSVPEGRKLTFILPDGSKVKLNGGSYLKYEQNHLLKQRKVILEGEGFFEVARDTINPFSVSTGSIVTTALGTSFNIKSYPKEKTTHVFLLTGKVQVMNIKRSSDNNLTLTPGEGAQYNEDDANIISFEFNKNDVLAWKEGIIKFKGAGITEVVTTLERWYGVSIQVNNPPDESWKINGTFENESLENVVKNISYTTTLTYTFKDQQLILNF